MLPPLCKLDLGLSARFFLFCIVRSPTVVTKSSFRRLQVRLEVKCNWYDDLVCYSRIANLDLGSIVSLAVQTTLRSTLRSRLV
jgi:hypothetical protein